VLLAWPLLGPGSRAEAGFALERSALTAGQTTGSLGVEFQMVLNGGAPAEPERNDFAGDEAQESIRSLPAEAPFGPTQPLDLLAAFASPTGGAPAGPSSAGSGPVAGLTFVLPLGVELVSVLRSGRLFLADERLNPPPFASRLFRPPRMV